MSEIRNKIETLKAAREAKDRIEDDLLEAVLLEFERSAADAARWQWIASQLRAADMEWQLTIPATVGKWIFHNPTAAVDALRRIE